MKPICNNVFRIADTLKEYFSKYGELTDAVIMRDKSTGRSRGFGFVTFADPSCVDAVMNEQHSIDGRNVEVKRAVPKEDLGGGASGDGYEANNGAGEDGNPNFRTRKVFVGGLPHSTSDSEFRAYFSQFGGISDAQVMTDRDTGRPRGFGFVSFDSEDTVDKIMSQPHEIGGKQVELKRAEPKRPLQLSVTTRDAAKAKAGRGDRDSRDNGRRSDYRGDRDRRNSYDSNNGDRFIYMGYGHNPYDPPGYQQRGSPGPPQSRGQPGYPPRGYPPSQGRMDGSGGYGGGPGGYGGGPGGPGPGGPGGPGYPGGGGPGGGYRGGVPGYGGGMPGYSGGGGSPGYGGGPSGYGGGGPDYNGGGPGGYGGGGPGYPAGGGGPSYGYGGGPGYGGGMGGPNYGGSGPENGLGYSGGMGNGGSYSGNGAGGPGYGGRPSGGDVGMYSFGNSDRGGRGGPSRDDRGPRPDRGDRGGDRGDRSNGRGNRPGGDAWGQPGYPPSSSAPPPGYDPRQNGNGGYNGRPQRADRAYHPYKN